MNAIHISRDSWWLTPLLDVREAEEQPMFPSAASPVPSPADSSQLLGEGNLYELSTSGVENPIQTLYCLLFLVQLGEGLVLPATPALLLSWEERGKKRMKMEEEGSMGNNYMCSDEA